MSTAIKMNVQFLLVRLECAPGAAAAWTWTVESAKRTSEDKVRVKYIVSRLGSYEKYTLALAGPFISNIPSDTHQSL
jgi:hypothetical protein